jgi:hypothetical protein
MYEEEEEEIRQPDKPIRECLLGGGGSPNTYTNYYAENDEDRHLKRVLEESETDYELQFAIEESNRLLREREERRTHFAGFRMKIMQFNRIDKINSAFYSELIGYIDKYESGEIQSVKVREDFYIIFCKILGNMRMTPEDKTRLLELIK